MPPGAFRLRVDVGVAVDFRGGGLEDAGADAPCEHQHVQRAEHVRLHRLDGVVLVVNGRGGAGEVVDLVHLKEERLAHVVSQQLETAGFQQVADVLAPSGKEVVEADDIMALRQQTFAQMRADEAGSSRDQHLHRLRCLLR